MLGKHLFLISLLMFCSHGVLSALTDTSEQQNEDDEKNKETRQVHIDPSNIKSIGCAWMRIYRLDEGEMMRIESNNYGRGSYGPGQTCLWRLRPTRKHDCKIMVKCPCFDIEKSGSFGYCTNDFLKISDTDNHMYFCGDKVPKGIYESKHEHGRMKMMFYSNDYNEGKGFMCYVACAKSISSVKFPEEKCPF